LTFEITYGSVPSGLALDRNTGIISGTPTAAGTFSFGLRVWDFNKRWGIKDYLSIAIAEAPKPPPPPPAPPPPPPPSPTAYNGTVTISGRWINHFTKNPIPGAVVLTWDGTTRRSVTTDSNGEFAITADTSLITTKTPKSFGTWPKCYSAMGFAIFRKSDGSLYTNVNIFDAIGPDRTFSVAGPAVSFGDTPFWPAVDFSLKSDIPVRFMISVEKVGGGWGNSTYRTEHYLSNAVPLALATKVTLVDSAGNTHVSPPATLPLEHGCAVVTLTFQGGAFTWVGVP